MCGAVTDHQQWALHPASGGIFLDVDPAAYGCDFPDPDTGAPRTPQILCSIVGDLGHWQGTHSLGSPPAGEGGSGGGPHRFRVIVIHPSARGLPLLRQAASSRWNVSWVGVTGSNTGVTGQDPGQPSATHPGSNSTGADPAAADPAAAGDFGRSLGTFTPAAWSATKAGSLYVDVDTRAAGFTEPPLYFTSLHGFTKSWRTIGSHVIYRPTAAGFRLFLSLEQCSATADGAGSCISKVGGRLTPHSYSHSHSHSHSHSPRPARTNGSCRRKSLPDFREPWRISWVGVARGKASPDAKW